MTRTESLREQLANNHELAPHGQTWQWDACGLHSQDRCTVCGLIVDTYARGQNLPDKTTYTTIDGEEVPLIDAVECR